MSLFRCDSNQEENAKFPPSVCPSVHMEKLENCIIEFLKRFIKIRIFRKID
jgi:hypothetical protein